MSSSGLAGSHGSSIFSFLRNLHTVLNSGCNQFTFLPTVQKGSLFSTPSPAFIVSRFFDDGHSDQCEMIPHCSLICISLMINDVEHSFMCLLAICLSSWRNVYLGLLPIFGLGCFFDIELHELLVNFGD